MNTKDAKDKYEELLTERDALYEEYCNHPNDNTWKNYCNSIIEIGDLLTQAEKLGLSVVEITKIP